ncbi:MAG: glutamine-hydrolyzing GMP synthase [bacterium]
MNQKVLILDFGSQYTQLIARRVRELSVYSEIQPCNISISKIKEFNPSAIILSGGPSSVFDAGAPSVDKEVFDLNVPVLGICYGLQLIAHLLGGKVVPSTHREYGRAVVNVKGKDILFSDVPEKSNVWMSHGDRVELLPKGFHLIASTDTVTNSAIKNEKGTIYGVQFHPEVHHSDFGKNILSNFLFKVAGLKADWDMKNFIKEEITKLQRDVKGKVICGVSGGVDSTVAAVLLKKALGDENVFPVFVNNGVLRKNEAESVKQLFSSMGFKLYYYDEEKLFLDNLKGVDDPEKKRKIIGHTFIDVFYKAATTFKAQYLAQGTLYPDVIESVSFRGPSATIKSHHNVGGLPEKLNLKLVEPFRELFKDEVRAVGRELGIPEDFIMRHPFPGPGLAVRVLGDITKERLDVLRDVDDIFISMLKEYELYNNIWQAFSVLLPVKSVGVMGDNRTYENVVALRAVTSVDGMTADWYHFPHDFLAKASNRIINEVKGVNRVCYDISSKPPATIEWE